jgi:hypothetical protein
MEENRIPKRVLYMNLETTGLRGRPRNRWQDEIREDGRIVGGEGWQEKLHNREEWKKLLRTAMNRCILHMPIYIYIYIYIQWKPLIMITLGPALFDKNSRLITLSGGYKNLHYLTQFIVTTFYMYKEQQYLF